MTNARFSWEGGTSGFNERPENPPFPGREGWGYGFTVYHVYFTMLPMK